MTRLGDDGIFEPSGGLGLADSLNALRRMITASSCGSVAELVSAAIDALTQHQDFDGCEVFIGVDRTTQAALSSGQRSAARMPSFLDPIVLSEVLPVVVDEGGVFVEPRLSDRSPQGCGSLLGIPITDGCRPIGGLIVWNEKADVLMPWHRSLLEMLAELIVLVLQGPGSVGEAGQDWPRSPVPPALPPGAVAREQAPGGIVAGAGVDGLTGLLDRLSFETRLEGLATAPAGGLRDRYVLFVDIDRFRLIREYGGDMTAERMIRIFADLLRREMVGERLLGRLGADQFGIVIERRSREQAVQLAESLVGVVDALRLSFSGQRYDISISVGIAELSEDLGAGVAVLRRAMQACRAAQVHGGGTVLAYHDNLVGRRGSRSEGRLLNRLTRALKDDELELYAQLIAPLGDAVGPPCVPACLHELLLRMRDDNGDVIGAGAFLTVAERYGLSVKLDRWVVKQAFWQIAATRFANDPDHRFTLNLSGHSIDDHGLLGFIVEQFEQSGLPPERICFEITETAAISDIGAAKQFVEALKKLGCEFALDDFGSGHSSFLYLRDLPIDYLKIDGELVREIARDPVSLAFVRTIEGVARLMGRRTIAEYVESEAIREAIAEIGCDYAQGYWIGCPVPLADVLSVPEV